jgi:hypothetical protein
MILLSLSATQNIITNIHRKNWAERMRTVKMATTSKNSKKGQHTMI